MGKLQHLSCHSLVQAMEAGDSVAEGNDGPGFIDANFRIVVLNLLLKELRNLVCVDLSHTFFQSILLLLGFFTDLLSWPPAALSSVLGGPAPSRRRWCF